MSLDEYGENEYVPSYIRPDFKLPCLDSSAYVLCCKDKITSIWNQLILSRICQKRSLTNSAYLVCGAKTVALCQ